MACTRHDPAESSGAAADEWDTTRLGLAVGKAITLLGAGHAGQILLSADAAHSVREALPPAAALRPLGVHRVKDLSTPQPL